MLGSNKAPDTNKTCWKGGMRKESSNIVSAGNKTPFSAKRDPKPTNNKAGRK